jgi:hypothetical protein
MNVRLDIPSLVKEAQAKRRVKLIRDGSGTVVGLEAEEMKDD